MRIRRVTRAWKAPERDGSTWDVAFDHVVAEERRERVFGHLMASAFGGEATPAGRFSGADVKKHS